VDVAVAVGAIVGEARGARQAAHVVKPGLDRVAQAVHLDAGGVDGRQRHKAPAGDGEIPGRLVRGVSPASVVPIRVLDGTVPRRRLALVVLRGDQVLGPAAREVPRLGAAVDGGLREAQRRHRVAVDVACYREDLGALDLLEALLDPRDEIAIQRVAALSRAPPFGQGGQREAFRCGPDRIFGPVLGDLEEVPDAALDRSFAGFSLLGADLASEGLERQLIARPLRRPPVDRQLKVPAALVEDGIEVKLLGPLGDMIEVAFPAGIRAQDAKIPAKLRGPLQDDLTRPGGGRLEDIPILVPVGRRVVSPPGLPFPKLQRLLGGIVRFGLLLHRLLREKRDEQREDGHDFSSFLSRKPSRR
jgi:hypothetical protein